MKQSEGRFDSNKGINLTLWIPTYNRPKELRLLLQQIQLLCLWKHIDVVVSDNSSDHWDIVDLGEDLFKGIRIERRCCNLSAGANFLRAFENCSTEWVHIMGDDDRLNNEYLSVIQRHISGCDTSIAAIRFDTELYGHLKIEQHNNLMTAISGIHGTNINGWFNNLLLISGWVFRREQICQYISQAYLGYGTKLSHLLPALACCDQENRYILFSCDRPIAFCENQDSWPKAASWVEMCINTQLAHGYLSETNRRALRKCLFGGANSKLLAKIMRIRAFYQRPATDVSWLRILFVLSSLSKRFMLIALLSLPLLALPTKIWPKQIRKILGSEGSADRW
ncbi:glycosyltransferase [Cyanobium sp. BA5m-21]|uniref:glycosyltransferase n=1 Tax=unclassified Cyanobium TaxID=2627006 RepID=UPI0020CC1D6B|nr:MULTISPECIES: glycosyltransferase [unclassified Cyanobium]MCP9904716.1 glycosyltransferase [Cyanobium sp. BA5m-10]MCP9907908.1 glycosyltransferase [Cyanobium sp. BA5m-21]